MQNRISMTVLKTHYDRPVAVCHRKKSAGWAWVWWVFSLFWRSLDMGEIKVGFGVDIILLWGE